MYKKIIHIRSAILLLLTHHIALPFLKLIRKPVAFPFSRAELLQMPDGSLGKQLILMLDKNKLQLLPYYAKHDLKHILLDYDTTDKGEVCLQCFMLGNRHVSFPVITTILFGLLTMPEHWTDFVKAMKRGRCSMQIEKYNWLEILTEPLDQLKHKINGTV